MRNLSRRAFLKTLALGLPLLMGGLAWAFWRMVDNLQIEHVTLPPDSDPTLPGITLVQLSDLHINNRSDVRRLERAVALTNGLEPDLVVLTGDYVRHQAETIELAIPALAELRAPLGVYAVLGNHDLWTDADMVSDGLRRAGVRVLINEGLPIVHGRMAFYLAGLDDGWSGQPDLVRALVEHDGQMPVVLLWHEPDLGEELVQQGRVLLQLSGHSHGGQVRLPGYGPLVLPSYAERYDRGLYSIGPGWIYVSSGIGYTGGPLRLNCPPEVTVISLSDSLLAPTAP